MYDLCMLLKSALLAVVSILVSLSGAVFAEHGRKGVSLHIDRKDRTLYVLDSNGKTIWTDSVGIGRGGLHSKHSMSDAITPTGTFSVDLILCTNKEFDAIAQVAARRFPKYSWTNAGLSKLFDNMDALDFNGDGKPDDAYGIAYIGLQSDNAITGPKLSTFKKTPYWYSIALHGTIDPHGIGTASSGGCVHLSEQTLRRLVEQRLVVLGTEVTISDKQAPATPQ